MQPTRADIATIEVLYRQHSPALVLFAVALTGERSRAQDAVHEAFLKLLERESLGHAIDVKAYLFACVRSAILNDAKVRQRDVPFHQESTWFDPPNRDYAAERNLRRALGALSEDQRQVTVLESLPPDSIHDPVAGHAVQPGDCPAENEARRECRVAVLVGICPKCRTLPSPPSRRKGST